MTSDVWSVLGRWIGMMSDPPRRNPKEQRKKKQTSGARRGSRKEKKETVTGVAGQLLAKQSQLETLEKRPLLILEVDSFGRPTATPPSMFVTLY
jgi:hypothetical protein